MMLVFASVLLAFSVGNVITAAADHTTKTVRIVGGDGNVTVRGYDGDIVKSADDAKLVLMSTKDSDGVLTIKAGDDNIDILVPKQTDLEITAPDGDIEVSNVTGVITARSEDGNVIISDVGSSVNAVSEDGSVMVSFTDNATVDSLNLMSEDGDVEVSLPADYGAKLSIRVSDGKFNSDFEIRTLNEGAFPSGSKDNFKATVAIGDGSGSGTIVVGDGSLTMKKR